MDDLKLSLIGQIGLPVLDLDRAVVLYKDMLGMEFLSQAQGMAFFDCGGIRLMLGRAARPERTRTGSILHYRVEDIHRSYDPLSAHNVKLLGEPHLAGNMSDLDLWMVFFRDSEGNTLALMSELRSE